MAFRSTPGQRSLALGLGLACFTPAFGACTATSGPTRNALIELYTSEGCDSCPPADRWLSHWRAAARKDVALVAFHVDYWDQLGWRDPFAKPAFSQRQRELAAASGRRMVYTPQVLIQGQDFREWRDEAALQKRLAEIHQTPARADIRLHIENASATEWRVRASFKPHVGGRHVAHLALLQHDLTSDVRAGENRGKQLQHDYVVRQWWGPLDLADGRQAWSQIITVPVASRSGLSLTAWVQNTDTGEVLQTLSMGGCWE